MQKYPIWKPALIVVVVAVSILLLYPPRQKLKLGLDLAGGTALTYQVTPPEGMEGQAAVEQVIAALRKRVDPQGVRNLVWVPQAGNRFEIQMALASPESTERRRQYAQQLEQLLQQNLSVSALDALLRGPTEGLREELLALAGDREALQTSLADLADARIALEAAETPYQAALDELEAVESELAEASDAADASPETLEALQARKAEALDDVLERTRAFNQAREAFNQAREAALEYNVDAAELESIFAFPDRLTPREREENPDQLTPRAAALERFITERPGRAEQIRALAEARAAYDAVKGPLEDTRDLIELIKGSGVLEFRIAAPADLSDAASYREQLQESGPLVGQDRPFRWFRVDEIERFAGSSDEMRRLRNNPVGYFLDRGLIGEPFAGDYYLLLYNTAEKTLTQAKPDWRLDSARAGMDESGMPAVNFRLNPVGGRLMGELTGANVQQPMAILLDGRIISAPRINDRISGAGIITGGRGGFSRVAMNYMITTLNAGSLQGKVSEEPISIVETGPRLGQDNLRHGANAAVWALITVSLFMCVYYFWAGLIANFALFANMVIILGVMSLINATFTLPGIAGIVLTVGMAVDANVLIFERIREEMADGADVRTAIRLGFEKAFSTIVDANLTTMITCMVLYYTATADLKGFALTLAIGIMATLFTALFCSRVFFELYLYVYGGRKLAFLPTVVPAISRAISPNIDWVAKRKLFAGVSAAVVILSLLLVFSRGAEVLDIEFRSGTQVAFDLAGDESLSLAEARERLDRVALDPANPLPHMASARASVVTQGVTQGDMASGFRLAFLEEDAQLVSEVVKAAFADVLDVKQPIRFRGMEEDSVAAAPVFRMTSDVLGESINRPMVTDLVPGFRGGSVVVIEDMQPAASVADITERIRRMRLQPQYESLGYREFEVIGLDTGPVAQGPNGDPVQLFTSIAVVSHDQSTDYIRDPESFITNNTGLAATEWRVIRDALRRDVSLGSVSSFSSQVSNTMKYQAIQAMALSLFAVVCYIWLRFGSLRYGLAAIVALVHDVAIALGIMAACHYVFDTFIGRMLMITDFKIDLAVVAALLTIVGYSLNDTIVVFDRIRENRGRLPAATAAIINRSINQTISRTLITSLTTLISLIVLYILGGDGVHGFAFSLLIGVLVGTYSSIAVAAPLLLIGLPQADKPEAHDIHTPAPVA